MEILFNPNEMGPFKIVIQMNNPTYCVEKAIETLLESKTPAAIEQAIALLALAKVQYLEKIPTEAKARTRS